MSEKPSQKNLAHPGQHKKHQHDEEDDFENLDHEVKRFGMDKAPFQNTKSDAIFDNSLKEKSGNGGYLKQNTPQFDGQTFNQTPGGSPAANNPFYS